MNMYIYKCVNEECNNEEFLDEQPEFVLCPICNLAMRGPLVVSLAEDVDEYDEWDSNYEPYDDEKDYHVDERWKDY